MKKLILFICASILFVPPIFQQNPLHAAQIPPYYRAKPSLQVIHPELSGLVDKLKTFPDSNQVIAKALESGSITVDMIYSGMPFEAMWESAKRKITIDGRSKNDQGRVLCHILFEMSNAISEPKYQNLYQMAQMGRIDCDTYVETVEKIEHDNMIRTADIIEQGIAAGVFPSSARWTIVYDFDVHYKIQQLVGHSLLIAEEFQDATGQRGASVYKGTVKNLMRMSKSQKMALAGSLHTDYFRSKWERRA